jgi:hypothetical protein
MENPLDARIGGRELGRLRRAREDGYLDARCGLGPLLAERYSRWCWLMKIPAVWIERRSRYSRYSRVHLDMFTTANRLSIRGQAAMRDLGALWNPAGPVQVSPHDVCWERIPVRHAHAMARSAYRAATRAGNYEGNDFPVVKIDRRRTAKLIQMSSSRVA